MPNTGPSDASRRQSATSFPMWPSPWVSDTDVVDFPSPAFVGVIAVTSISFPSGLAARRSSTDSETFALYGPYWSTSSGSSPAAAAISAIGRTPTREALRRLAQEKLVEVYPRRGMFVTGVDVRELARLSEVRLVLEPEAARLAAERAPDA